MLNMETLSQSELQADIKTEIVCLVALHMLLVFQNAFLSFWALVDYLPIPSLLYLAEKLHS